MDKSIKEICQICAEGNLVDHVSYESVDYKGTTGKISMHFSVCDCCGSEQANEIQLRENKREMIRFKKNVDHLLSGEEIKAIRRKLQIKQSQAANIFGGGPVAFSKYENDDVAQSEPMDKLLRLTSAMPAAFIWLAHQAGEIDLAKANLRQVLDQIKQITNKMPHFAFSDRQFGPFSNLREQSLTMSSKPANDHDYGGSRLAVGG